MAEPGNYNYQIFIVIIIITKANIYSALIMYVSDTVLNILKIDITIVYSPSTQNILGKIVNVDV